MPMKNMPSVLQWFFAGDKTFLQTNGNCPPLVLKSRHSSNWFPNPTEQNEFLIVSFPCPPAQSLYRKGLCPFSTFFWHCNASDHFAPLHPGGGGLRIWVGILVVLLRGVSFGFWSHLGCSGHMYIFSSLLGVKKSLGHAQIGLLYGFNSKCPTSIPTPFICGVLPTGSA